MSTILINKVLTKFKGSFGSNTKTLFGETFKFKLKEILELKRIKENVFMKELSTDLLSSLSYTLENENILKSKGYSKVEYENYTSVPHNSILTDSIVDKTKIVEGVKTIKIGNDDYAISVNNNKISLLKKDNFQMYLNIEYQDIELKEVYIDNEYFIYLSYEKKGKTYLIKSHLALQFFKFTTSHHCSTLENEIEYIFKIETTNQIDKILSTSDTEITYLSSNILRKIKLGRMYYFAKNENLFFNIIDNFQNYENVMQIEHLHMYDWISILGLNQMKDKNGLKLSTIYSDKFNDIIRFKFDDTLNGTLNYFDFFNKKDYRVDFFDSGIELTGNFKYGNYEKGDYLIKLFINKDDRGEFLIIADLIKGNKNLKRVKGFTVNRDFYFCNLKINISCYECSNRFLTIPISIKDDYSVNFIKNYTNDLEDTFCDIDRLINIDRVLRNENHLKKQIIDVDFDDKNFIIKNFVKDSNARNYSSDLKIKFIEDNGNPSVIWKQIKDKDYFLNFEEFTVNKKIRPKRKVKPLFKVVSKNFKFSMQKEVN